VILKGLVASADFNGDRIPDLVGITEDPADRAGFFRSVLLLGLGNGSFRAPIPVGPYVSKAVADFNRDGKLDLLVHCAGDNCAFAALFGNGDGTFQPPGPVTQQPPDSVWAAVADFNGDGKLDVVETSYRPPQSHYVYLWLGNGDGTLAGPMTTQLAGDVTSSQLVAGDFNGDGRPDLAVLVGSFSVLGHPYGVEILLGDGKGSFTAGNTYPTPFTLPLTIPIPFTLPLTISDFQHSGGLDLAAGFTVLPGHRDGMFETAQSFGQYGPLLTPSGFSFATSQPGGDTLGRSWRFRGGREVWASRPIRGWDAALHPAQQHAGPGCLRQCCVGCGLLP
jgi:hypothetical protein